MADSTLSPNMSLPVPNVSEAPGPTWAQLLNQCMTILDAHTHGPGQGVQISPSALLINADLSFGTNNATDLRSVRFTSQNAALSDPTDIGCLYEVDADLYYNDGDGNQIRMTQSGSVAGSAGTITGLPSGTASASYSTGTFTFRGATNTPAAMNVGPISVGNATLNSKQITIYPYSGIAANFDLVLPPSLPAATNYVTLDNTGQLSFNTGASTGSGAVVLANAPTIIAPTLTGNVPTFQAVKLSVYPNGNTSSTSAKVPGVIYVNSGTASNSGTGETDLFSYTFPANSFATNDCLTIKMAFSAAASSTVRAYFGGTQFLTSSTTSPLMIISVIKRTGSNTQYAINQVMATASSSVTAASTASLSVTDSSSVIIKVTGQSASGSNSVTCSLFQIIYEPSP